MERCDKLALAGVIIVSLEGAAFTRTFAYRLYFERLPIGQLLTAIAGWVLATYGPILVAALFWHLAKRSSVPWLLHILLPVCFYGLLVAGNRLMLTTVYVGDFDATMGAPIMPAFLSIIATLLVYFSASVASIWKARSRATNVNQ